MPALIERRDTGSEEPPRKKRCLSPYAEIATGFKRRRSLEHVDVSKCGQFVPKEEFINEWLTDSDWYRQRKRPSEMSQLPLPARSVRAFARNSAATASSQKSTASVQDTLYRETLEQYNIYIMGEKPPPGFIQQVEKIVFRQRESPELDDAVIEQLRESMRELQNRGEEEVRCKLGPHVIPGYSTLADARLEVVHGQLWNKAVAVPPDLNALEQPVPLPKPKPDTTFGYSKAAFDRSQLSTRFPFAVIEYKSQAKDGSIRVATNQAAGASAVALNGLLELMSRCPDLDASLDFNNKPLFFSVTMDQNSAYINVGWIGKTPDTNQHTFNLEELRMLPLKYGDSIHVLRRALKNMFDYAVDVRLDLIIDALNEYRNKFIKQRDDDTGVRQKLPAQAEPRAPPSPPPPPPPARKKARENGGRGRGGGRGQARPEM